jgi:hypothetical protein
MWYMLVPLCFHNLVTCVQRLLVSHQSQVTGRLIPIGKSVCLNPKASDAEAPALILVGMVDEMCDVISVLVDTGGECAVPSLAARLAVQGGQTDPPLSVTQR